MTDIMVSIYVPTFNHENYITQALDSILMQKVDFLYEVYVGEDCSTDNTRQVLKAWEAAHPESGFHFFYRTENMHQQQVNNASDLKSRCKGKYIICLEGDDYWTDASKLQKQVDFLETHPDYYAVAHNCVVVDENSHPVAEQYPQCYDQEYTMRHFASDILPGQYTTFLSRNYLTDPHMDKRLLSVSGGPGDRRVYFSVLCHGKIHCMQTVMSAYRHITTHGSSFSATNRYDYSRLEAYNRAFLDYAYALDCPEAIKCAEFLYLRNIRHAKRVGHINLVQAMQDAKNIRHIVRSVCLLVKRDINYRIFHKTLHI